MTKPNNYPYQDSFEEYLINKQLSEITIQEYSKTLMDLFNYLSNFNLAYQKDHRVNNLFNRDIENYLTMAQEKRQINNNTYNKILSHINVYFTFLFTHHLNSNLPTIDVESHKHTDKPHMNLDWLSNIDNILQNGNLHFYTRMTILLISKGYKVDEILQPNFYKQLSNLKLSHAEKSFIQEFNNFIQPIQEKQNSKDIFLKQRISSNPHITTPGLHKYLKPSEQILGFSLSPSNLFQSYVVNYIQKNPNLSNLELSNYLNLDLSSVVYYKKLVQQINQN